MPVVEPLPVAVASPAPTKPVPCRDSDGAELPAIVEIGGGEGGTGSDNGGAS